MLRVGLVYGVFKMRSARGNGPRIYPVIPARDCIYTFVIYMYIEQPFYIWFVWFWKNISSRKYLYDELFVFEHITANRMLESKKAEASEYIRIIVSSIRILCGPRITWGWLVRRYIRYVRWQMVTTRSRSIGRCAAVGIAASTLTNQIT